MGGYGTYKLATMFPDLFAAIAPVVPCPSAGTGWQADGRPPGGEASVIYPMLAALRNVPTIAWMATTDEFCVYNGPRHQAAQIAALDALGYQYSAWTFTGLDHDSFAAVAESNSQPLADYLGTRTVTRDPARITYVLNAAWEDASDGLTADHAYWLSGLSLRDPAHDLGSIDVYSHGLGLGQTTAQAAVRTTGVLDGGVAPLPYTEQSRAWAPQARGIGSDRVDITATNVAAVTIDAGRAGLSCRPMVVEHSDGPLAVRFTDCPAATATRPAHRHRHRHRHHRRSR